MIYKQWLMRVLQALIEGKTSAYLPVRGMELKFSNSFYGPLPEDKKKRDDWIWYYFTNILWLNAHFASNRLSIKW